MPKKGPERKLPTFAGLQNLVNLRQVEFYFYQGSLMFAAWQDGHDIENISKLKEHIDSCPFAWKSIPALLNFRSICYFILDRNAQAARGLQTKIKSIVKKTGVEWYYSDAFLLAYQGKFKEGLQAYRRAFKMEAPLPLPVEIETFIVWTLQNEPEKIQFHFFLGLINYRVKNDRISANADFETFLKLAVDPQYQELVGEATKAIEELALTEQNTLDLYATH